MWDTGQWDTKKSQKKNENSRGVCFKVRLNTTFYKRSAHAQDYSTTVKGESLLPVWKAARKLATTAWKKKKYRYQTSPTGNEKNDMEKATQFKA